MLPRNLVLVRHGESEGNIAVSASKAGDDSLFTPQFRNRHSRTFRLTDKGVEQAQAAGRWIRENILPYLPIGYFYVSDYIRAKETAFHLQLPGASWKEEHDLRERDMALMDNIPHSEKEAIFAREVEQYKIDPFLSYPAGGGESVANLCLRVKVGPLEHLARQRSEDDVIVVCHGHVMRTLQLEIENLGHDDFIRLDKSDNPRDKIRNCQILWYTRRDPNDWDNTSNRVTAVRSVCPWDPQGDYGWRHLERKLKSNEDLRAEVEQHPRHVE